MGLTLGKYLNVVKVKEKLTKNTIGDMHNGTSS